MTTLGLLIRWLHLGSGLLLVGIVTISLLAGRGERATAVAWEARVLRLARWLVGLVLLSGLAALAHQAVTVTGRPAAALELGTWLEVLLETRFGTVWLARHGLLLLLAALLLLRQRESRTLDWAAVRVEAWCLAAAAAALMAWAGHAGAVDPDARPAILADSLHLLAAGAWLGALPPLAALLHAASREAGADARPYAVLAVRRFSTLARVLVGALVVTGLWNAWTQVGDVPGLLGTRYGQLLLLKTCLLLPILGLAWVNRRRLLPALSGDGPTVGRPAMRRLAALVTCEWALGLLILGVVAGLALTPPARHESPWWPFSHRLSWEAARDVPGVQTRLLLGSQAALLGIVGGICGFIVGRRRALVATAAALLVAMGALVALPPLAVDAYPTTFIRPGVPYSASSLTNGLMLFQAHCAPCHGARGAGDGPAAAGLPARPPALTTTHVASHTAGDLFWWITHGIPRGGMPAFADLIAPSERWDLVNLLRALASARQAREMTPAVATERPSLVAPDFAFAVGPTPERTLRDFRGRRHVVLVLFGLPASRARLGDLARAYEGLQSLGAELVAVPADGADAIISRLGGDPPVLFPVVTEGGEMIARAYALFLEGTRGDGPGPPQPPTHAEFLIDRQGYIRARWMPGGPEPGWENPPALLAQIRRLNQEAPAAPAPDEHVH